MAVISILASSTPRVGTGFTLARAMALASAMFEARRSRRVLAEMDGRLLADIGASTGGPDTNVATPVFDGAREDELAANLWPQG